MSNDDFYKKSGYEIMNDLKKNMLRDRVRAKLKNLLKKIMKKGVCEN